jgi:hypothetical protein
MSLDAGTKLGAYNIVALIGAGGMGWAALTRGIGRLAKSEDWADYEFTKR